MQIETLTKLQMTIAKIGLKQLEVIDRLSERHDDYVIRCVTKPDTNEILVINGDWEEVTGWSEGYCVNKNFNDFIEGNVSDVSKDSNGFDTYFCNILTKKGTGVYVDWKGKHYPEINATVSIGRVTR